MNDLPQPRRQERGEIVGHLDAMRAMDRVLVELGPDPSDLCRAILDTQDLGDASVSFAVVEPDGQRKRVRSGMHVRLTGPEPRGHATTAPLVVRKTWVAEATLHCECDFPAYVDSRQRRETFRATLRQDMHVAVTIQTADVSATGVLHDLSLGGCAVRFDAEVDFALSDRDGPLGVELTFPNGTRFAATGRVSRTSQVGKHRHCGLRFGLIDRDARSQLWSLVLETEREAARNAASEGWSRLEASALYLRDGGKPFF